MNNSLKEWFRKGDPWVWMNAGALSISIVMVVGILLLVAARGLSHFWPHAVMEATYTQQDGSQIKIIGEVSDDEWVPVSRLREAGVEVDTDEPVVKRILVKTGNRDITGLDFRWLIGDHLQNRSYPDEIIVIERREWGNFYGYLKDVKEAGQIVASDSEAPAAFEKSLERADALHDEIRDIERGAIGAVNYELERLRLEERGLERQGALDAEQQRRLSEEKAALDAEYEILYKQLRELQEQIARDSITVVSMGGVEKDIHLADVVQFHFPNSLSLIEKIGFYFHQFWLFLSSEPREANTEGGVFPAIFGTVLMVLLMSIIVTPFGVVAAVYLREYAKQGATTRVIRIAVNNLAGVPSIVYGVFGLGFFVYFMGGSIDDLFFPEAAPAPVFGTPGLLWASITLSILTLPVVIVATEEGLARIPKSVREGSLALGATKFETIWKVVLPMASPAMMTGLILAIARAAGEVAPLMLVGVVKLAPTLPLDGNFPFLHLDRKFMHLGFHIYDVGFQSPNVEAARPLVYATAFLLVAVIVVLNLTAIMIRNRLREKFRALEN